MQIKFRTENGSTYVLDDEAMIWERLEHQPFSNLLRSQSGDIKQFPLVELGKPVVIIGTAFDPQIQKIEGSFREIITSNVVAIDTENESTRIQTM